MIHILVDKTGYPLLSFNNESDLDHYQKMIPASYNEEHKPFRVTYSPKQYFPDYPYCYIWTWDHTDNRNKDKWNIKIMSLEDAELFIKAYKRDLEVEKREDWDDQYFYFCIIRRDGICYSARKAIGMPTGIGTSDKLSYFDDHYHMIWHDICKVKSQGIYRAFVWSREEISDINKYKHVRRKFRILANFAQSGAKLTQRAQKKYARLGKQILRSTFPRKA